MWIRRIAAKPDFGSSADVWIRSIDAKLEKLRYAKTVHALEYSTRSTFKTRSCEAEKGAGEQCLK